jgi:capsular exopolysaccharide synthesis family protein
VTTNLAIAIADIGWKVLLIDADLRRPRLHKIFGVDNKKGLSLLFYGGDPAPIDDLVYKTDVPSLFLLPAGPAVINRPTSLLHSAAFQELLMRCRTEFDVILIDTPPMLPYSDARIVATLVDGVILVLRNGKTSRDAAASATQRLREDGTPVVGAILNECDSKAAGYGYGYGYQSVSH